MIKAAASAGDLPIVGMNTPTHTDCVGHHTGSVLKHTHCLLLCMHVCSCLPAQGELLAELEGEMFDLRDQLAQAAGAAAKAESLEGSLNSTKDQLLRLTADFENFRKRTVSSTVRQGAGRHMVRHRDQQGVASCMSACVSAAVGTGHTGE
jgi:hypothetical protein